MLISPLLIGSEIHYWPQVILPMMALAPSLTGRSSLSRARVIWPGWRVSPRSLAPGASHQRRVVTSNIWSGDQTGAAWHTGDCDVSVTRCVTKHEQTTYHCNYITIAAQVILIQISAKSAQDLRLVILQLRWKFVKISASETAIVYDETVNIPWSVKVNCFHKESFTFT